MLYFILRRILQIIPVIIGVTLLIFILMYIIPEDPARLMLPKGATPEALPIFEPAWVQISLFMCNTTDI